MYMYQLFNCTTLNLVFEMYMYDIMVTQVSDDDKQSLEEVMFTLSEKVKQRRVLVKPCFEDFDRYKCTCMYMYIIHLDVLEILSKLPISC